MTRHHPETELVNAEDLQPGDLIWHGGGWAAVETQWYADRDGNRAVIRTSRGEVHAAAESPVEVLIKEMK